MAAKKLFREKALEQLSSPEQLDQLLRVVNRKSWLPLSVLAAGLVLAVVWSVMGEIPVNVEGEGLFVYPRQVISFQSPADGQIVSLEVAVGDNVEKGQVLGRINQPHLQQLLDQERVRLAELQARNQKVLAIRDQRTVLQKGAIDRKHRLLERRIESSSQIADTRKKKNQAYFAQQRDNLKRLKEVSQTLHEALRERYESYKILKSEGLSSEDAVLNARRNYIDNKVQLADVELKMQEIELRQIEAEDTFVRQMDHVADLQSRLQELEIQAAQIDQEQLESTSDSELGIQEIQRKIARYERELQSKGQILSEYNGRLLEITAAVGQMIREGQRLGAIEAIDPEGTMVAVAYFPVSEGKKIRRALQTRITPTTVQRERHGSMLGRVHSVSRFPVTTDAVTNVVGNAEVARSLVAGGSKIEVFSELESARTLTGYKWTSGEGPQNVTISAGTTVTVRTTVETRQPISYVIPILRRWSGI